MNIDYIKLQEKIEILKHQLGKKFKTTEIPLVNSYRRSGNTTRQVDAAIQMLFDGNTILVLDHWERGTNDMANNMLYKKIVDRFRAEHGNQFNSEHYHKYKEPTNRFPTLVFDNSRLMLYIDFKTIHDLAKDKQDVGNQEGIKVK